ncbi:protein ACCELERATED CELL DEATH 6-like [Elaeis guineensis]|uniref:protein ACCELERATED CELL DEATH 6-like n=1 Tax=Elaeis guineensis var. tenera TaxID=51953 RepID=UPI003C6D5A99
MLPAQRGLAMDHLMEKHGLSAQKTKNIDLTPTYVSVFEAHKVAETLIKERMTATTVQIDSNFEVLQSEIQPLRIAINSRLLKAARSGEMKILNELLQQELTQNNTNCLLGVTLEGNTALHIAASRGYAEFAWEICRRKRSLLTAPNTRLDTPLHSAARAGNVEIVSHIIHFASEDGIKHRVLRARNRDESNALHEAAQYNHVRVAKVLMEQDAELASMLNGAGMSPLYLAVMTGSFDVAKVLLRSFSWESASLASFAGPNKKTALHVSVFVRQGITRDILQQKASLAKEVDSSGRTPLHYAASDGHHGVMKLLLKHDRSSAYLSDVDGLFPIHIAARMGNFNGVYHILEQCPDTDELLDKEGKNFLHAAFQKGQFDLVKKLICRRRGLKKLLNNRDYEGNTPLHTVVENSDQRSVHFLLREETLCVNVMNNAGFTPLDLAFAKLDEGLHFLMNGEVCIASCLALMKGLSGPRGKHDLKRAELSSDEAKENPSCKEISTSKKDKEFKKCVNLCRNFAIASVLIATVTFAAGFTLPGGYIADDHAGHGTAVLAKRYTFKVFLISDAFALVCSIIATFWFTFAGTSAVDKRTRGRALRGAMSYLWGALTGMSTAFAMGIYVVLAPSSKHISMLLCSSVLSIPFFACMVAYRNVYSVARTIIIRQGFVHWIWPTMPPYVQKRFHRLTIYGGGIFPILYGLLSYEAAFFLLAML